MSPTPDDTIGEIVTLSQRILSTKLWNEGVKARDIAVPAQYHQQITSGHHNDSASPPSADQPPEDHNDDSTTTATTRSEQVWGGKPWKTSVVDLEGEVLCSEWIVVIRN